MLSLLTYSRAVSEVFSELPFAAERVLPERPRPPTTHFAGYLRNYLHVESHDAGAMDQQCGACSALHWAKETRHKKRPDQFTACCAAGEVVLDPLSDPPEVLRDLYTDNSPQSRGFVQNIRQYNSSLAFTAIQYEKDTRIRAEGRRDNFMPFSIHGELLHKHGPLQPRPGDPPRYLQLFFYDPDYAADVRSQRNPNLDRRLLLTIANALQECNPYIRMYKAAHEQLGTFADNSDMHRIVITAQMQLVVEQGADHRRHNLPVTNEIALLIPTEYDQPCRRDVVVVSRNSDALRTIDRNTSLYMNLHYVLLFPCGSVGFHWGLRLQNLDQSRKRDRMGQRQFYRYRLHLRPTEFSVLFRAARLFQQYVVDAYGACDCNQMDWIRDHQKTIRADL